MIFLRTALQSSALRSASIIATVLLAVTAAADERTPRWQADIDVARDAWLASDRSYSTEARATAERRLADLRRRVPALDDSHIVAELARIAALSGNAHTRAYVLRNRGYWRRYPVRIWKFADGWRVVAAQGPGLAMLGRKVVAIADTPIELAQVAVRPLFASNDRWADYMATYSLTSPEALRTSGVIPGDSASFVVLDERGSLTVKLDPMAFAPRERPEESWWFLSPAHPGVHGWSHVLSDTAMPVALKNVAANYWAARCANNVLFFQFNRAQDADGEPMKTFGERLVADIRASPPRTMVVDLRFNTGGDATKGHQFLKQITVLPWVREPGRLQVILGPSTFSAGITHAVWLRQETAARLIGTEPGDELDTWAEGGNVDLPNSKLRLHYADKAHLYSNRPVDLPAVQVLVDWNVESLTPDVATDWTWRDYLDGRDPFTEAALGAVLDCPN